MVNLRYSLSGSGVRVRGIDGRLRFVEYCQARVLGSLGFGALQKIPAV